TFNVPDPAPAARPKKTEKIKKNKKRICLKCAQSRPTQSVALRGKGFAGPLRVCCLTHVLLLPAAFAGDQNQENGHRQFSQLYRIQ
ncbi:hypothetical protein AB9C30_28140, partial [Klebsiella pneumoniae]|uniref:hypothetical protein n=1 Tax=Klebsiella pneumoniae TaxID=573 RepID=UPI00350F1CDF